MVDAKDIKEDNLKREVSPSEQTIRFEQETIKAPETVEVPKADRIVSAELRKEIEMMKLDPNTMAQAEAKAEKIEFLGENEKIGHLLEMARKHGVLFAIHAAKETHDPYLLDILHDALAQEGYYKDFTK